MATFPAVCVAATGTTATTGASSAAVALPNAADGNRARFVMVTAKATAYIKFGASGVTATANDILVGPGAPVVFAVKPFTHFAHLQETGATLVNVVPVEF
ncbi:MAG: hypothetical protein IT563_09765 [Alphaproteobacteria bacterium]|nr:hypothetical protein [Alphaproteobacteria bacterium]